jgi:transaldolase
MRPNNLKTKIFLDSGDPSETREAIALLGFLDGQTTNPSLIAKSPGAKERVASGEKFTKEEILSFYKETVTEIRSIMPTGSISVEVYADKGTPSETMVEQGKLMHGWISEAHIKLPTTAEGLKAARQLVDEGYPVNMTLVFSQAQAAAVYSATTGAKKGQVFLSPFLGRVDDAGYDDLDLVKNIRKMYDSGDGHVEMLVASIRDIEHFLCSLDLGVDIMTVPFNVLKEWSEKGVYVPDSQFFCVHKDDLAPIEYEDLDFLAPVKSFNIQHDLTDKGLQRFSDDWNTLLE